jgi:hypothetical protein
MIAHTPEMSAMAKDRKQTAGRSPKPKAEAEKRKQTQPQQNKRTVKKARPQVKEPAE